MKNSLRILISAYACSPFKGSEPGVGWGYVSAVAKYHEIWAIVEAEKYQADIESKLWKHWKYRKKVHFYYIHKKRNRIFRKIWPPSYYWYYRKWHEDAYELAKRLNEEVHFDLAHQLTMVGYREPGYLWKLGIPFVWGPIGGMNIVPWQLLNKAGIYGFIYYLGYNIYNCFQMLFLRRPRLAAKKAGLGLIAATNDVKEGARKYWGCDSTIISEVGIQDEYGRKVRMRQKHEPLRIIWSGQHTPGKTLNIGLEALSHVSVTISWVMDILGTGKRTSAWKNMAERLKISEHCHFLGLLPRQDALKVMKKGHVLLITSLKDLTSTVTVEALSLGLPIICLDHCGFADAVTEECGIKIPITTPGQIVLDMASAIERMAFDEKYRLKMARGALKRAKKYTWDKKVKILENIYRARIKEHNINQGIASVEAAR